MTVARPLATPTPAPAPDFSLDDGAAWGGDFLHDHLPLGRLPSHTRHDPLDSDLTTAHSLD